MNSPLMMRLQTDTMSYTAAALSFMFENLSKPIVLTGSQVYLSFNESNNWTGIIALNVLDSYIRDKKWWSR